MSAEPRIYRFDPARFLSIYIIYGYDPIHTEEVKILISEFCAVNDPNKYLQDLANDVVKYDPDDDYDNKRDGDLHCWRDGLITN